ncbi:Uu.00g138170.m01.CDS01 [Anthostomella pinea]|uniref:Uu.00g138170.m01.CDS01 n=1 Tax=Anthostomella pinea TaxID=933095 RepID=A0AAI8YIR9_9PEZI|nr:Uu.00g138170.m01.CDS01 [Anthostomella pinea]
MKFAQEFRKALQEEAYPQKWIDSAIPYGQLKKCLKKVISELQELGLDRDTLSQLAASQKDDADLRFRYNLAGDAVDSGHFRPRLTVFVHLEDGVAVDAKLTPYTRDFLHKISSRTAGTDLSSAPSLCEGTGQSSGSETDVTPPGKGSADLQRIEVPLVFDGEFFEILQTDVSNLDSLQAEEQEKLTQQIITLGGEIQTATKPSKGRKARGDLATWRGIFELYLAAQIFFSTRETDHGARTSSQACKQLEWFQQQVVNRKLDKELRLDASRQAFGRFVNMNVVLLQILKFQELNSLAITKILKSMNRKPTPPVPMLTDSLTKLTEFDKRTSLGVSKAFPVAVHSDRLLTGSVARDVCAQMSNELIPVIPQLDDYLCPICFAIAYWPIKLQCDHIFCSRCLVKMSRKNERLCPLCRADTVMMAGIDDLDRVRAAFMREYFPKEVKEKVKTSARERNKEIFGPHHSDVFCSVM